MIIFQKLDHVNDDTIVDQEISEHERDALLARHQRGKSDETEHQHRRHRLRERRVNVDVAEQENVVNDDVVDDDDDVFDGEERDVDADGELETRSSKRRQLRSNRLRKEVAENSGPKQIPDAAVKLVPEDERL